MCRLEPCGCGGLGVAVSLRSGEYLTIESEYELFVYSIHSRMVLGECCLDRVHYFPASSS